MDRPSRAPRPQPYLAHPGAGHKSTASREGVYEVVKDMVPCVALVLDYVKGCTEAVRLYGIPDEWIRPSAADLLAGAAAVGAR